MKVSEAIEMLKNAPCDDKPSRINSQFTRAQSVTIVRNAFCADTMNLEDELSELAEKRVLQVTQDRKCPKWECPICHEKHNGHWDRQWCIKKHKQTKGGDECENQSK